MRPLYPLKIEELEVTYTPGFGIFIQSGIQLTEVHARFIQEAATYARRLYSREE